MSAVHRFAMAGAALLASASFAFAADAVRPLASPLAAAAAPMPWDGFVSIDIGQLNAGSTLGGSNVDRQTVRGSVSTMMAPNWGTQFDVLGDFANTGSTGLAALDAAGHLYFRSSSGLLGAFGEYRHLAAGAGGDISGWFGGAEGQRYFMKSSVDGQIAFQDFGSGLGGGTGSTDGWLVNGSWNYFFLPNFKVDLSAAYDSLNGGLGSGTINTAVFGIGSEVRFNGPLSLFAKYEFENVSESGSSSINANNFLIGGKWNVGSTTLWQRETTGASLDPVGGIISFLR
jgi:hypothetical protein